MISDTKSRLPWVDRASRGTDANPSGKGNTMKALMGEYLKEMYEMAASGDAFALTGVGKINETDNMRKFTFEKQRRYKSVDRRPAEAKRLAKKMSYSKISHSSRDNFLAPKRMQIKKPRKSN